MKTRVFLLAALFFLAISCNKENVSPTNEKDNTFSTIEKSGKR